MPDLPEGGTENRGDLRRPTWLFLILFLLACALWRASYVPILWVQEVPPLAVAGTILGWAWIDVAIALPLVLGFVAGRWWTRALVLLLFAWAGVARLSDYGYFYYSGCHIDLIAIEHAQGNALGMSLDRHVANYLLIGGAVAFLCLWPLLPLARRTGGRGRGRGFRQRLVGLRAPIAAAVVLAGCCWSLPLLTASSDATTRRKLAQLPAAPEVSIPLVYMQWRAAGHVADHNAGVPALDPVVQHKLERFGLHYDVGRDYPLLKHRVYRDPLPFPRSQHFIPRPSIIVIFLESFSAALTSVYDGSRHPGLTPNLEDFGKRSHLVWGFFNSSTPTITALTCSYCSYLPVTNTRTWWLPQLGHGKTRLRCLPHILREHGYHTAHVHTLSNDFVRTGEAMQRMGFEEVLDQRALWDELRERALHWGYSDHQLFRFLVKRLEARRFQAPFLLSTATVDSHAPFVSDADSVRYGDGSNELLNSIHTADHAFGTFWSYFKGSPYVHNTMVIVLADHAMFPGKEHADVRQGEDITGRYYDKILCGIYNPTHEMAGRSNLVSAQVDLAPTILHMLGLNVRNHFEGHSIFEGRRLFPELIGMHEYLFWIYQTVDGKPAAASFTLDDVKGRATGVAVDATTPVLTQDEYFHFYRWKQALHVNNRIWK